MNKNDVLEFFVIFVIVLMILVGSLFILKKIIEPKVKNLVRGKKGFLKGNGWLYYKFVSFEQAYPLLQELVRDLPNI